MNEQNRNLPDNTLVVNEIFHSIQGESSYAGLPCVFVRLTYCNIRCSYCDTAYAFEEGEEMTIQSIVDSVQRFDCRLLEVTGGEPLFQKNVLKLLSALCDDGYEVLLETGGSLDVGVVDPRVKKIVDFKCPSSKMVNKNLWKNVEHLRTGDEVKFVIGTREDFDWAKEMITRYEIHKRCPVLMSVVFDELKPIRLAEWILQEKLEIRFQLQMHKYIWHPETKGV